MIFTHFQLQKYFKSQSDNFYLLLQMPFLNVKISAKLIFSLIGIEAIIQIALKFADFLLIFLTIIFQNFCGQDSDFSYYIFKILSFVEHFKDYLILQILVLNLHHPHQIRFFFLCGQIRKIFLNQIIFQDFTDCK